MKTFIIIASCVPLAFAIVGTFVLGYLGIFQHSEEFGGAAVLTGFLGLPMGLALAAFGLLTAAEMDS